MKKYILSLTLAVFALCANAQSTTKWPFGAADFQTPTVTSKATAQTITVTNNLTFADLGTVDTNKVLTVALGTNYLGKTVTLDKGARLFVKWTSGTTARTLATSAGCSCLTQTGTTSKAWIAEFVYDGSTFYCVGAIRAQN